MTWESVDQGERKQAPTKAPLAMALSARANGDVRLWVTISPELRAELGWELGERFGCDAGRGANAGQLRLRRDDRGRALRILPRSEFCAVELLPPFELAGWQAPRQAAEYVILKGGTLVATLPWVFEAPEASADDQTAEAAA